eukprot:15104574-Alexandrium_andersonii.AAC.1
MLAAASAPLSWQAPSTVAQGRRFLRQLGRLLPRQPRMACCTSDSSRHIAVSRAERLRRRPRPAP